MRFVSQLHAGAWLTQYMRAQVEISTHGRTEAQGCYQAIRHIASGHSRPHRHRHNMASRPVSMAGQPLWCWHVCHHRCASTNTRTSSNSTKLTTRYFFLEESVPKICNFENKNTVLHSAPILISRTHGWVYDVSSGQLQLTKNTYHGNYITVSSRALGQAAQLGKSDNTSLQGFPKQGTCTTWQ